MSYTSKLKVSTVSGRVSNYSSGRMKASTRSSFLAASRVGLHAWVKGSPWSLLLLALGGGYLAGRVPAARTTLIWSLAQLVMELVRPVNRGNHQLFKHR